MAAPSTPTTAPAQTHELTTCDERGWSAYYVPVWAKFAIAVSAATAWFVASAWLSAAWISDLTDLTSAPIAWGIVLTIALVPGWLNAFLVWSLLLDRPPRLCLPTEGYPDVTVLIAAFNEEESIGDTLRSIRAQDYPGTIHTIVVDDGSTDDTVGLVSLVAEKHGGVRLLKADHGGKALALNHALDHVATEFVITIDADTWLHQQALKRLMARFLSDPTGTAAVAGCVLARNSRHNVMTRMQDWDYFLAIASVKRQQALYQGTLVAQGAFSAYRTHVVREVGGWPNLVGEDIVLTWSMIERGYRIGFESSAVSFTNVPTEVGHFARQRKRWARGMIEGLRYHGDVIYKRRAIVSFLMAIDLLFPVLDLAYTLIFIPGVILAFTGRYWIAGPMTLAILPLTFLITAVMYFRQKRVFDELGLRVRKNVFGYLLYLVGYQLIMSPVCVAGYAEEIFGMRRRW